MKNESEKNVDINPADVYNFLERVICSGVDIWDMIFSDDKYTYYQLEGFNRANKSIFLSIWLLRPATQIGKAEINLSSANSSKEYKAILNELYMPFLQFIDTHRSYWTKTVKTETKRNFYYDFLIGLCSGESWSNRRNKHENRS